MNVYNIVHWLYRVAGNVLVSVAKSSPHNLCILVYQSTVGISDRFADGKHLRQREGWQRWVVQGQTPGQPGYPGPGESFSLASEASLPSRLNVGFFF